MDKNNKNLKVLIMAGGTGGHIFPALSIARSLMSVGINVEWLGTESGMEAKIIGESDIPIHYISVNGLRGKSLFKKMCSPVVIIWSILQSIKKIKEIKPNCVLGMGGFVTGPGGIAAWLLRIKLCIHEQNAIAGFSNQMLLPFATTTMEGFDDAFKKKNELFNIGFVRKFLNSIKKEKVGNPVRAEIVKCVEPEKRFLNRAQNIRILILGGSLGAEAINKVIPEMLGLFSNEEKPEVLHQCGRNKITETKKQYIENGIELNETILVKEFIEDMAEAYSWADLIICRAGALTVSEISVIGVPSVLIPYPFAVDDHQTENAKILERVGAADILLQRDLTVNRLYRLVRKYSENRSLIVKAALAARSVAEPQAVKMATEFCVKACYA